MEDLDAPRVVPGAADEILRALERYGLLWDGAVEVQSRRTALYEEALARLREEGSVFDCACSRAEIASAAAAPDASDAVEPGGPVYPGTCREGLPPGRAARAVRFRVPEGEVTWRDLLLGPCSEETARAVGDIVVRRADGPFAYQLAVVVDDGAQGVTQVVRGADLLSSTARQILLQRALGLPEPAYGHLPLVVGPDGKKLGKRWGALPLETLDARRVSGTLALVLALLGQRERRSSREGPAEALAATVASFDPARIPHGPVELAEGGGARA